MKNHKDDIGTNGANQRRFNAAKGGHKPAKLQSEAKRKEALIMAGVYITGIICITLIILSWIGSKKK